MRDSWAGATTFERAKARVTVLAFRILITVLRRGGLAAYVMHLCPNAPYAKDKDAAPSPQLVAISLLLTIFSRASALVRKCVSTRTALRLWRDDLSSLRPILGVLPSFGPLANLPLTPIEYVDVSCPAGDSVWFNRPAPGDCPPVVVMYIHGGGARPLDPQPAGLRTFGSAQPPRPRPPTRRLRGRQRAHV